MRHICKHGIEIYPVLHSELKQRRVWLPPYPHHHLSSRANPESRLNTWFSGFQLWKMCKIAAFVQNGGSKGRNVGKVIGFLYSTGMPDRTITLYMQLINNTIEDTFAVCSRIIFQKKDLMHYHS